MPFGQAVGSGLTKRAVPLGQGIRQRLMGRLTQQGRRRKLQRLAMNRRLTGVARWERHELSLGALRAAALERRSRRKWLTF